MEDRKLLCNRLLIIAIGGFFRSALTSKGNKEEVKPLSAFNAKLKFIYGQGKGSDAPLRNPRGAYPGR